MGANTEERAGNAGIRDFLSDDCFLYEQESRQWAEREDRGGREGLRVTDLGIASLRNEGLPGHVCETARQ